MFREGGVNVSESREKGIDRRRTLRIRYSGLKRLGLDDLEKPSIKFAETKDELEQAFALVYQVYSEKKVYNRPKGAQTIFFHIFSLA